MFSLHSSLALPRFVFVKHCGTLRPHTSNAMPLFSSLRHLIFFTTSYSNCPLCNVVPCDSLVEEGEQVSHDDEGFVWLRLEDLFDVNGPLLEALHRWNTHPE